MDRTHSSVHTLRTGRIAVQPAVGATTAHIAPVDVSGTQFHESGHDTPLRPAAPVGPSGAHAALVVLTGADAGQVVSLKGTTLVIGRDEAADLVLDDPSVSRRHARVMASSNGGFMIEDLGSTNGTFLRGQRIQRAWLAASDRVQLGQSTLVRFEICDEYDE